MGNVCVCPPSGPLNEISNENCAFNIKQIQKIVFQRGGYIWTAVLGDPTLKADWDALKTASDDTKVVSTPLIGGDPKIVAGEVITKGGNSNETRNGQTQNLGKGVSAFEARFDSLTPAQEGEMAELECEPDLTVYFVNEDQTIFGAKTANDELRGFRVESFFLSERTNDGFATNDYNMIKFNLEKDYSINLKAVTPEDAFNPLVDL